VRSPEIKVQPVHDTVRCATRTRTVCREVSVTPHYVVSGVDDTVMVVVAGD
jgi:hypothetical protein